MRIQVTVIAMSLILSACAGSITKRTYSQVWEGMPVSYLLDEFGSPSEFSSKQIVYRDGPEACFFDIQDSKVREFSCTGEEERRQAFRVSLGAGFKAMGDSMGRTPAYVAPVKTNTTTECRKDYFGNMTCNSY